MQQVNWARETEQAESEGRLEALTAHRVAYAARFSAEMDRQRAGETELWMFALRNED
jgi:hypothetical protein